MDNIPDLNWYHSVSKHEKCLLSSMMLDVHKLHSMNKLETIGHICAEFDDIGLADVDCSMTWINSFETQQRTAPSNTITVTYTDLYTLDIQTLLRCLAAACRC